jgi:hypothetical protein
MSLVGSKITFQIYLQIFGYIEPLDYDFGNFKVGLALNLPVMAVLNQKYGQILGLFHFDGRLILIDTMMNTKTCFGFTLTRP